MLKRTHILVCSQGCQRKEIMGFHTNTQAQGKCFRYLEIQEEMWWETVQERELTLNFQGRRGTHLDPGIWSLAWTEDDA